jgi:hypothetical protein
MLVPDHLGSEETDGHIHAAVVRGGQDRQPAGGRGRRKAGARDARQAEWAVIIAEYLVRWHGEAGTY